MLLMLEYTFMADRERRGRENGWRGHRAPAVLVASRDVVRGGAGMTIEKAQDGPTAGELR